MHWGNLMKQEITNSPLCSSLYEPNEELISLYNNLEVVYSKLKENKIKIKNNNTGSIFK